MSRLAISNIAWPAEAEPAVADVMADLGIDGVEVAPTRVWPRPLEVAGDEVRRHRAFWEERGIGVVALQALLYGRPDLVLFGPPEKRRALREHLAGMMRLASLLGAGPLVLGAPGNRATGDLDRKAALDIAVPFFRDTAADAERHGVVLCIEPNPPAYGCDFVTTSAEGLELVERVGRPGFGLHLDAAGMHLAGEDPASALEACAGRLRHFHASEPHLAPVGEGPVDHDTIGATLARLAYDHRVSVEMRPTPDRDPPTEIHRALTFLKAKYA